MIGRSETRANNRYRETSCPLCGQGISRPFLCLETAKAIKSTWGVPFRNRDIWKCPACQIQFAEPREQESRDQEIYGDEYHNLMAGTEGEWARSGTEEQSQNRIHFIRRYVSGGRLLDVGCSTGDFMDAARLAGFEAYGLDTSAAACRIAREFRGFGPDRVENAAIIDSWLVHDREYDAITLWDVIEHLDRPGEVMGRVRSGLRNGGFVFVRTPNANSPFFRAALAVHRLSRGWIQFPLFFLYHTDHRFFFNKKSLQRLLAGSGFEVKKLAPDPLIWKRFRYAECRRGFAVNATIALIYFLSRFLGSGHGLIAVARK